jgi:hypothetical protein
LTDVRLEKNGVKVNDSATISGKNITFVIANGGMLVEKADSVTFKSMGSGIDRDASNNTIQFKLNQADDLSISEVNTGYSASVLGEATSLGLITLIAGDITISKAASSPSATSYTKSTKGVTALLATVKANQAFTADGMVLHLVAPTSTVATKFENIKLYVNGVLIDSVNPTTNGYIPYDSSVSINQGNNTIEVKVDITSLAVEGDSITVALESATAFTTPVFANDESATSKITGDATAGVITVATAGMTATRSDGFSTDKLVVKGAVGAVLGRFTVKALNDAIKVTSIALGDNIGSNTQLANSNLSNLMLFVDGAQIGSTKSFSDGATFGSLALVIAKDTTKVVELRGNINSSAAADNRFKTLLTFTGEDSRGKDISDVSVNSVQVKVADSGTLTIAKDGNSAIAGILAAMTTGNSVAKFKLTATNDDITLKKVYISNVKGIDADARISNIDLYANGTKVGSAAPSNGEVNYNLNSAVVITKGASVLLEARVDLNQIDEAAQTDKDIQLAITKVTANSSAGTDLAATNNAIINFANSTAILTATTSAASSTFSISDGTKVAVGSVIQIGTEEMLVNTIATNVITVTRGINGTAGAIHATAAVIDKVSSIAADSFRVRKTYPIITLDTLPSTVLTSGDNVVAKIKISAQANADVTISSTTLVTSATVNTVQVSSSSLNSVRVDGAAYTGATVTANDDNATGHTLSSVVVEFTTPVTVAAGTTKTIEVVLNVTAMSGANNNLTTKIVSDVDYATIGTFVWSDNSDPINPLASLAGSYKVLGIPTVSQSLSQN